MQLYEDEKAENERLRKELKKSHTDLDDVKHEVSSLRSKNDSSRSIAETADKRVCFLLIIHLILKCFATQRFYERNEILVIVDN